MSEDYRYEPIPDYGSHMSIEKFIMDVKSGCLIDYDGHGKYATKYRMTDKIVGPSDVKKNDLDKRFTHIVWFNK